MPTLHTLHAILRDGGSDLRTLENQNCYRSDLLDFTKILRSAKTRSRFWSLGPILRDRRYSSQFGQRLTTCHYAKLEIHVPRLINATGPSLSLTRTNQSKAQFTISSLLPGSYNTMSEETAEKHLLMQNPTTIQGVNSMTFMAPPFTSAFLTLPELFDWHFDHSKEHPFFVYFDEHSGKRVTVRWADAVKVVRFIANSVSTTIMNVNEDAGRPLVGLYSSSGLQRCVNHGYSLTDLMFS